MNKLPIALSNVRHIKSSQLYQDIYSQFNLKPISYQQTYAHYVVNCII